MAKLTRPDLPENALANVRSKVLRYFGNSNKTDEILVDETINDIVKEIHRKWHPKWSMPFVDFEIPVGNGIVDLPINFQKIFEITGRSLPVQLRYRKDADYRLLGFNTATRPVRQIQWIKPPTATALEVRMKYYKRMVYATFDADLISIDEPNLDLVVTGARAEEQARRGNLNEYDRLRLRFEKDLQDFIDDDTDPDDTGQYIGNYQDGGTLDIRRGELVDGPVTQVGDDTLFD